MNATSMPELAQPLEIPRLQSPVVESSVVEKSVMEGSVMEGSVIESSVNELVRRRAELAPEVPLFTFIEEGRTEADRADRVLSCGELETRARQVAALLAAHGVSAGERALLLFPPGLEFLAAFFGCLQAGVLAVPAPYPVRPLGRIAPRIAAMAEDCRPACVLSTARLPRELRRDLWAQVPALEHVRCWEIEAAGAAPPLAQPHRATPGSVAFLQYTSGSTSRPRGVMVTHGNLLANCRQMGQTPGSKIVSWLPLHHDFGLVYGLLQPVYSGTPAVLMAPGSFLQRPLRWLEAIQRFGGTHCPAPNFAFDLCVRAVPAEARAALDLRCWEAAVIAAEPIRQATVERFLEAFACAGLRRTVFMPAYGLAEATLLVARGGLGQPLRIAPRPAASSNAAPSAVMGCGAAAPGTRLSVVDPVNGAERPEGSVGEIWVAGPSVALGYWQRPEETRAVFQARGQAGAGPYLRTGDLGFLSGGELFVTGREKELLVIRGENVYPYDIEASVERCHPAIVSGAVAAFGVESEGEEGVAVLVELERRAFRAGQSAAIAAAIRGAVSEEHGLSLALLELLPEHALPRTSSGKLQRALYRDAHAKGELRHFRSCLPEAASTPSRPAPTASATARLDVVVLEIHSLAAPLLRGGGELPFEPERPLRELGLDSIGFAELASLLTRRYDLRVGPEALFSASLRTLAQWAVERQSLAVTPAPSTPARAAPSNAESAPELAARATEPAASPSDKCSRLSVSLATMSAGTLPERAPRALELSLFCFGECEPGDPSPYEIVIRSAQVADQMGLGAVWLPERHFHEFGGISPNPSVLAAALSRVTSHVRLRAGSVILPLHHPFRVAEEWALVDNLSNGRVDLAFGWGWNAQDFVLAPQNFAERRDLTLSNIELVRRLWRGEKARLANGRGTEVDVGICPRPLQSELPVWLTCTQAAESFMQAGALGYNVLTALLFQSVEELGAKLALYRAARQRHGHDPAGGHVTVMLHTHLGTDVEAVRHAVREPLSRYLASSVSLWRQEAGALDRLNVSERQAVIEQAFERYFQSAGLFGTPESCLPLLGRLRDIGVTELAALIDFGLDRASVLAGIPRLGALKKRLEELALSSASAPPLASSPSPAVLAHAEEAP